jgi:hypothetical protein
MNQLNLAATFAATTVLTMFSLAIWQFEGRPFDSPSFVPPMKAEKLAYLARQSDDFGGKFGVRGPRELYASAGAKLYQRHEEIRVPAFLVPVHAVAR